MQPRDLSDHLPYSAGRGVEEVARELGIDPDSLVKLSSNEHPFGPSPKAVEAIQEAAGDVHTYPKALHTDLTAAVADRWDIDPAQVWLAAGGDGVLDYLGRAMLTDGDRVLVPDPGFAYYPMSARYHGAGVDQYRLRKANDFALTAETVLESYDGHRIVYVTTPHNPTGAVMEPGEIERLADETADDTLVVVDEAYGEFSPTGSARTLLETRDDVCVVRTFSKAYGLAGLRLGYGLMPAAWADAYDRVNTPFAVNVLACHAGLAALKDRDYVEETLETVEWSRAYLRENLEIPTWESGGNFVLAEVEDAGAVTDATKREGIILRDCSSFGLPDCVRISCGTDSHTRQAVETLNEVCST